MNDDDALRAVDPGKFLRGVGSMGHFMLFIGYVAIAADLLDRLFSSAALLVGAVAISVPWLLLKYRIRHWWEAQAEPASGPPPRLSLTVAESPLRIRVRRSCGALALLLGWIPGAFSVSSMVGTVPHPVDLPVDLGMALVAAVVIGLAIRALTTVHSPLELTETHLRLGNRAVPLGPELTCSFASYGWSPLGGQKIKIESPGGSVVLRPDLYFPGRLVSGEGNGSNLLAALAAGTARGNARAWLKEKFPIVQTEAGAPASARIHPIVIIALISLGLLISLITLMLFAPPRP